MKHINTSNIVPIQPIIQGLLSIANPKNHIPPSHYGHQDQIVSEETFNKTTFLYDVAIWVILLNRTGHTAKAKRVLDFLTHHYYKKSGMTGEFKNQTCFRNAFDLYTGDGIVEWFMTPGPVAFMIFAYLDVYAAGKNQAYRKMALQLGEILLKMQKRDGGVYDGDRSPDVVNTEPHVDCFSAFLRIYSLTSEERWMVAAQEAYDFFIKHLYVPGKKTIYQGTLKLNPFASDTYTWTLLGKTGDFLSLEENIDLTDLYLEKCLARSTLHLPDGKLAAIYGLDFSDPFEVMAARGGFHPMVSLEWTAGAAASLQNVAIRLWKAHKADQNTFFAEKAVEYKALAEFFVMNTAKGFYRLPFLKHDGVLGFYASGQSVPIGHGWNTVNFYYKNDNGQIKVGGSLISSWIVFPAVFYNPLSGESYKSDFEEIPFHSKDLDAVAHKCGTMVKNKKIREDDLI